MIIISEDFDSTQEDEVKEKGVKSKNRENRPSGNDNNFGRFSPYSDDEVKEKGVNYLN